MPEPAEPRQPEAAEEPEDPGRPAGPGGGRLRPRLLLLTCAGLFMTQLDLTVVNVAVGAIRSDLGASATQLTWVVDAYFVTFAAFMIGFGDIGDVVGRLRVLRGGLVGFLAASLGAALATDASVLITFRALQGVAGAAVLVSSLALLVDNLDGAARTRAIGVWSAVAGTSLVVGPPLGGFVTDTAGWRGIFWMNLPIVLFALACGHRMDSRPRQGHPRGVDWLGQLLAVTSLAAAAWGISQAAATRGSSPAGWLSLAAGVLLGAVFAVSQRRTPAPLVPPQLFASPAFRHANLAAALVNFGTLGLLFLLGTHLTERVGLDAATAGWRIAPLFASYVVASLFAGRIARRLGPRRPAAAGCALAGAAVAVLAATDGAAATTTALLAVCGTGFGIALPAIVSTAVAAVPPERGGLASGLNNTSRQIGGTLGVALLGGIIAGAHGAAAGPAGGTAEGFDAGGGMRTALAVTALAYLLAALASARAVISRPGRTP